jgi:uncharacterized protein
MSSLSCPDVNVWLALLLADHVHRGVALRWWKEDESDAIVFCRLTQVAVLRLLTTAAAMNGRPLTMRAAWAAHDRLFADDRVAFVSEPADLESAFRTHTRMNAASPKIWADAYLTAFAQQTGARLVTFDKALARKATGALLLA